MGVSQQLFGRGVPSTCYHLHYQAKLTNQASTFSPPPLLYNSQSVFVFVFVNSTKMVTKLHCGVE